MEVLCNHLPEVFVDTRFLQNVSDIFKLEVEANKERELHESSQDKYLINTDNMIFKKKQATYLSKERLMSLLCSQYFNLMGVLSRYFCSLEFFKFSTLTFSQIKTRQRTSSFFSHLPTTCRSLRSRIPR